MSMPVCGDIPICKSLVQHLDSETLPYELRHPGPHGRDRSPVDRVAMPQSIVPTLSMASEFCRSDGGGHVPLQHGAAMWCRWARRTLPGARSGPKHWQDNVSQACMRPVSLPSFEWHGAGSRGGSRGLGPFAKSTGQRETRIFELYADAMARSTMETSSRWQRSPTTSLGVDAISKTVIGMSC